MCTTGVCPQSTWNLVEQRLRKETWELKKAGFGCSGSATHWLCDPKQVILFWEFQFLHL